MANVNISEEVIRASVTKDSTERLKSEMGIAQNYFDAAQIDVMSRDKLISYVTHLSGMCNQTESVTTLIVEFDPKLVKVGVVGKGISEVKEVEQKLSVATGQGSGDMSGMLFALLQNMNKRDEDARKREDEFKIMMLKNEEERIKREDEVRKVNEEKDAEKVKREDELRKNK